METRRYCNTGCSLKPAEAILAVVEFRLYFYSGHSVWCRGKAGHDHRTACARLVIMQLASLIVHRR
jgi:hypothetical protein